MMKRFLFTVVGFVSVFMLPWWSSVLILLVMTFYFIPYYEAVLLGFLLDAIYIYDTGGILFFGFPFTFLFAAFILLSLYAKERLRFGI